MALQAETVLRPLFLAAGGDGDGEVLGREALPVFLVTKKDRPVDPMIWRDEKRMKRELLVWAKAVASMHGGQQQHLLLLLVLVLVLAVTVPKTPRIESGPGFLIRFSFSFS